MDSYATSVPPRNGSALRQRVAGQWSTLTFPAENEQDMWRTTERDDDSGEHTVSATLYTVVTVLRSTP